MKSIPKGKVGILHFSQLRSVKAEEVGQPDDSGNGYYSYSYYILPFTGIAANSIGAISQILHKRFYSYPFNSMGFTKVWKEDGNRGGEILFCVTYHHGD